MYLNDFMGHRNAKSFPLRPLTVWRYVRLKGCSRAWAFRVRAGGVGCDTTVYIKAPKEKWPGWYNKIQAAFVTLQKLLFARETARCGWPNEISYSWKCFFFRCTLFLFFFSFHPIALYSRRWHWNRRCL